VFMCVGLVLLCDFVFFVFVCFCGGSDFLAPNENIVRFRCEGGQSYTLFVYFW